MASDRLDDRAGKGDRLDDRVGKRGFRPSSESDWRRCLGRRVSLRYRLHDDPDHPFSEALGTVQSVTAEAGDVFVSLVDKRGGTMTVALEDIEAAKVM